MKKNKISKLILGTLISMCSLSSYSQNQKIEFSLKCKVKVDYSDNRGNNKTEKTELIIEVEDEPKRKYIGLSSTIENVNNLHVIVPPPFIKDGETRTSYDSSNENKYDIQYSFKIKKENFYSDTKIYLNRNNGEILVTRETILNNYIGRTSIGGTCEKIDTTKKKF